MGLSDQAFAALPHDRSVVADARRLLQRAVYRLEKLEHTHPTRYGSASIERQLMAEALANIYAAEARLK